MRVRLHPDDAASDGWFFNRGAGGKSRETRHVGGRRVQIHHQHRRAGQRVGPAAAHQMIQSATGLILRTRHLTETSLIVHWLTPDFGRIATVAQGARRPKSPFLGKLDLFYVADFSFSRSRRSDLHRLREVGLRELHAALRQNLATLRQATYATAFIEQATETET